MNAMTLTEAEVLLVYELIKYCKTACDKCHLCDDKVLCKDLKLKVKTRITEKSS